MSLSKSINNFAFNLLVDLSSQNVESNVFFSPLSISTCLAICLNGAANKTKTQLFNGLQLNQSFNNQDEVNQSFEKVIIISKIIH